jgi:hypothetical protein
MNQRDVRGFTRRWGEPVPAATARDAGPLALEQSDVTTFNRSDGLNMPPRSAIEDVVAKEVRKPVGQGHDIDVVAAVRSMVLAGTTHGAAALRVILAARGYDTELEDCQTLTFLIAYRPFSAIKISLGTLYTRPQTIGLSNGEECRKAAIHTEEWLKCLHDSPVFQAIISLPSPITREEFAEALRSVGACRDESMSLLALLESSQPEYKPLLPGGWVAIALEEVVDFSLDVQTNTNGEPSCTGMRDFAQIVNALATCNNLAVKEIVGGAINREITTILSPLTDGESEAYEGQERAEAHLLVLRDGLLRACNRRLATLYEAVKTIPPGDELSSVIENLAPTPKGRERALCEHTVNLALLGGHKKVCGALAGWLRDTPPEHRTTFIDLFLTAPHLIECVDHLIRCGCKPPDRDAIAALVRPLPYTPDGESLATLIARAGDKNQTELIKLLANKRELFVDTLTRPPHHQVGGQLMALLVKCVQQDARGGDIRKVAREVATALNSEQGVQSALSVLAEHAQRRNLGSLHDVSPGSPLVERDGRDSADEGENGGNALSGSWAAWVPPLLFTADARKTFFADYARFNNEAWYMKMLLVPASCSAYLEALNTSNGEDHNALLAGAEAATRTRDSLASLEGEPKPASLADYTKIIVVGGWQQNESEERFQQLLHSGCDVQFYYDDNGPNTVRNLTPIALGGKGLTMVVFRPNCTDHAVFYKVKDMAEGAGVRFIALPKGIQNPLAAFNHLTNLFEKPE